MTHFTNCEIKEDFRDELDKIADAYWNGDHDEAERRAQDLGWEKVGGGMGRVVWRVSPSMQDGERNSATKEAPCVVKFAVKGRHGGRRQNNMEISQFERFPSSVTDSDPPVVVPIKDWADDRSSWLSMPEVDAEGGHVGEAQERLAEKFWHCSDIYTDNVGEMHDTSVVLDYGLDCEEMEAAIDVAEEIGRKIGGGDGGTEFIGAEEDGKMATVTFRTPGWIGDGEAPESEIIVDRARGPIAFTLIFGPWDESVDTEPIRSMMEDVADKIDNYDFLLDAFPQVINHDDGFAVEFEVDLSARREEAWDAYRVDSFYDYVVNQVRDGLEHARPPEELLSDIRFEMREGAVTGFGESGVVFTGTETRDDVAFQNFRPPDDSPGFERPENDSWVMVNGGFRELRSVFGPWQDEKQEAVVTTAAGKIVRDLEGKRPTMDFTWEKLDGSGADAYEIAIYATDGDADEAKPLGESAEEIGLLYRDVLTTATARFPPAIGPDDPGQQGLSDFIDGRIDAALASLGFDSADSHAPATGSDDAEQRAEALAADLYGHVFGDEEVSEHRVESDMRDMLDHEFDAHHGETVELQDDDEGGTVVTLRGPDGEEFGRWSHWERVVSIAASAPDDQNEFIRHVRDEILHLVAGRVEEMESAATSHA